MTDAPAPPIKPGSDDHKVLDFMRCTGFEPGYLCIAFGPIMWGTGLDRRRVRLACRRLARNGLTFYAQGLQTEDGEFRGAGYGITRAGCKLAEQMEPEPIK